MLNLKTYKEFVHNTEVFEDEYMEIIRILNRITDPSIYDLTVNVLNKYSDKDKMNNANEIGDTLVFLLENKKLIQPNVQQSFVSLLMASTLMHNIIKITKDNWNDVFKIRLLIAEIESNLELRVHPETLNIIYENIENQLGEDMPIKGCKPNPNTPGEMFATSVALVNKYLNVGR